MGLGIHRPKIQGQDTTAAITELGQCRNLVTKIEFVHRVLRCDFCESSGKGKGVVQVGAKTGIFERGVKRERGQSCEFTHDFHVVGWLCAYLCWEPWRKSVPYRGTKIVKRVEGVQECFDVRMKGMVLLREVVRAAKSRTMRDPVKEASTCGNLRGRPPPKNGLHVIRCRFIRVECGNAKEAQWIR